MKSGSYHRIGKYDFWLGYQGEDFNILRIEWLGNGLHTKDLKIDPTSLNIIKSETCTTLTFIASGRKIEITESNMHKITLKLYWWFIPTIVASGKETGYKSQRLLEKICSINKI